MPYTYLYSNSGSNNFLPPVLVMAIQRQNAQYVFVVSARKKVEAFFFSSWQEKVQLKKVFPRLGNRVKHLQYVCRSPQSSLCVCLTLEVEGLVPPWVERPPLDLRLQFPLLVWHLAWEGGTEKKTI